jgi:hypothetical protein
VVDVGRRGDGGAGNAVVLTVRSGDALVSCLVIHGSPSKVVLMLLFI